MNVAIFEDSNNKKLSNDIWKNRVKFYLLHFFFGDFTQMHLNGSYNYFG